MSEALPPRPTPAPYRRSRWRDIAVVLVAVTALAGPLLVNEVSANRFESNRARIAAEERDRLAADTAALADAIAELEAIDDEGTAASRERFRIAMERADALEARIAALEARQAEADEAALRTLAEASRRRTTTTTAPAPVRTAAAAPPVVAGGDRFAALAACESTGDRDGAEPHRINPAAVNPTGKYRGAFQFDMQTWQSVGGTGDPAAQSYATQLAAAQRLQAARGWGPWPSCSSALGYR